jgi:hypothetical protein
MMKPRPWFVAVLVVLLAAGAGTAQGRPAPTSLDRLMDSLEAVHRFRQAALAPDGHCLAWVEVLPAKGNNPPRSVIRVTDLAAPDAAPRRIMTATARPTTTSTTSPGRRTAAAGTNLPTTTSSRRAHELRPVTMGIAETVPFTRYRAWPLKSKRSTRTAS